MISLQLHKLKGLYTEAEKELAKHRYHQSAAGYKQLRKAGCNLPHENAVRIWINDFSITLGFCNNIFSAAKQSLAKLPTEERLCALKIDEFTLRCFEEYSQRLDCIEGLVNLGP
ncbi:uncharacterized protein LOC117183011 [Belonocnema kinseyi]|uniref:uncharacterized protein LOC117183011 n=1 Tax=Belonocnema kinseyi TaxID=2817044 RepID=UPI00143D8A21|nr:uncharacterized protein LOC117183011 [Belonocnema kinseyi]